MKIAVGCDHGGIGLKDDILALLGDSGQEIMDMGTDSADSVDYPDFASLVAGALLEGRADLGILICGTGIGMSISANKYKGIRAAAVHDCYTAEMSRRHNNANIITFGGRVIGIGVAANIIEAWLNASFEGGRHNRGSVKLKKLKIAVNNAGCSISGRPIL